MKPKKMSLKEIQGVLSRDEMKKIMAGSGQGCLGENENCDLNNPHCCPTYTCQTVCTPGGNVYRCE